MAIRNFDALKKNYIICQNQCSQIKKRDTSKGVPTSPFRLNISPVTKPLVMCAVGLTICSNNHRSKRVNVRRLTCLLEISMFLLFTRNKKKGYKKKLPQKVTSHQLLEVGETTSCKPKKKKESKSK